MRSLLFALLCLSPLLVLAQEKEKTIQIEEPWSRATPPGATLAAGYMTVRNSSEDRDRLLSVSSPLARKVETHVTLKDSNNVMRMREVPGYEVPGRGRVELKPGGAHLMLVDIKQPFKAGDKVPLTLRFEKAGEVKVELTVRGAGTTGDKAGGDMPGGHMMH